MKTLAQYLAEYIDHEMSGTMLRGSQGISKITEIIKQGIEAYQSTENCRINVVVPAEDPTFDKVLVFLAGELVKEGIVSSLDVKTVIEVLKAGLVDFEKLERIVLTVINSRKGG